MTAKDTGAPVMDDVNVDKRRDPTKDFNLLEKLGEGYDFITLS